MRYHFVIIIIIYFVCYNAQSPRPTREFDTVAQSLNKNSVISSFITIDERVMCLFLHMPSFVVAGPSFLSFLFA